MIAVHAHSDAFSKASSRFRDAVCPPIQLLTRSGCFVTKILALLVLAMGKS
jgi:hypothetical protein